MCSVMYASCVHMRAGRMRLRQVKLPGGVVLRSVSGPNLDAVVDPTAIEERVRTHH